jgi:hypothetical protein
MVFFIPVCLVKVFNSTHKYTASGHWCTYARLCSITVWGLSSSYVTGYYFHLFTVDDQASLVQRDELQRCKLTNIELTNETVDLHKEIETLKGKVSELVAENHNLKGDLNRLPGM